MLALHTYTAFEGKNLYVRGSLIEVALKVKERLGSLSNSSILIFSDSSGKTMDLNFQGSEQELVKRLSVFVSEETPKDLNGPGRPKLGVISREVSLLPRHWEWLASQSGGASATLRRLIEVEVKTTSTNPSPKLVQERTYKVMNVMAGDLRGYEEALRALYKRDEKAFLKEIAQWPSDVRDYVTELGQPAFDR